MRAHQPKKDGSRETNIGFALLLVGVLAFGGGSVKFDSTLLQVERAMVEKTSVLSTPYAARKCPSTRKAFHLILPKDGERAADSLMQAVKNMDIPCSIPPYPTWEIFILSNIDTLAISQDLGGNVAGTAQCPDKRIGISISKGMTDQTWLMSVLAHEAGHTRSYDPMKTAPSSECTIGAEAPFSRLRSWVVNKIPSLHSIIGSRQFAKYWNYKLNRERTAVHYELIFHKDYLDYSKKHSSVQETTELSNRLETIEEGNLEYSQSYAKDIHEKAKNPWYVTRFFGAVFAALGFFFFIYSQIKFELYHRKKGKAPDMHGD